ncbi:MAG: hypothetical protein SGILL_001159 [Bacillariaceae sp.]
MPVIASNQNINTSNIQDASYSMLFSPAASSLASTPGGLSGFHSMDDGDDGNTSSGQMGNVELEIHWEPSMVKSQLLQASAVLSHRGLKLASKWAAEQVVGIPVGQPASLGMNQDEEELHHDQDFATSVPSRIPTVIQEELLNMTEKDWYAKSLLEVGEYLHAAAFLSRDLGVDGEGISTTTTSATACDITQIGPPLTELSSYGVYLRAYALYMAGERRKEEEYSGLESEEKVQTTSPRNPYLRQLVEEVSSAYDNGKLDAFGLYVYGLILKDAQQESIVCPHAAHLILVESILEFPVNWSAWLDLCDVVVGQDNTIEQQVEETLQPTLATHYMYHFFCAHLMAHHHQAHEDALILLERLYEPLPDQPLFQSTNVKTQLAVVHYHLRELEQALQWFQETNILQQDKYNLDFKDVYSNILYVKEDRVALSHLAHEAVVIDKCRPETCCIVGNYYSLKQQRQKAVMYFQLALELDRTYTSAWTLMGHEYVELKLTEQAMEAYRRAVSVSPRDYRAWYGLGQTYEFLNMYLYALFYYNKAAMLRPYDARMWCAVGQCLAALHRVPDACRAYERAVAQDDSEGIATQKLAALYQQEDRQEEAAQCYLRHLELRYLVTSQAPAEHPTLDDIVQGIALDAIEAEALLFLAQYHRSHGEFDVAALMCSRLVEYPGPEKEHAKGLLRDLRSRSQRAPARATPAPFQFSP